MSLSVLKTLHSIMNARIIQPCRARFQQLQIRLIEDGIVKVDKEAVHVSFLHWTTPLLDAALLTTRTHMNKQENISNTFFWRHRVKVAHGAPGNIFFLAQVRRTEQKIRRVYTTSPDFSDGPLVFSDGHGIRHSSYCSTNFTLSQQYSTYCIFFMLRNS
jgi:hypothetical protein